ncbi:hypothetical protein LIA77_04482 [Sarocladium implicatum]|nr:hypothetical protein LIA77_04482 [Sarocladium implicatum]
MLTRTSLSHECQLPSFFPFKTLHVQPAIGRNLTRLMDLASFSTITIGNPDSQAGNYAPVALDATQSCPPKACQRTVERRQHCTLPPLPFAVSRLARHPPPLLVGSIVLTGHLTPPFV